MAGEDYLPPSQPNLTLTMTDSSPCVSVTIVDDDLSEYFERMLVLYSFNSNASVLSDNDTVQVIPSLIDIFIGDDDSKLNTHVL